MHDNCSTGPNGRPPDPREAADCPRRRTWIKNSCFLSSSSTISDVAPICTNLKTEEHLLHPQIYITEPDNVLGEEKTIDGIARSSANASQHFVENPIA